MAFPSDYFAARQRFREAAARLRWFTQAYPIAGTPAADLTIDVAISPDAAADRVLVLSSGLHGVEGAFGSAVQVRQMEEWIRDSGPPPSVRVVLIHALNPSGFATIRRCDAHNVDPNRNFHEDVSEYVGSPDLYTQLNPLLNPPTPPGRFDLFLPRALWALARYGMTDLKQALAAGQYEFSQGLFFGGRGPSSTLLVLRQHMASWIGRAGLVAHLDFHTGLGRWGTCKLILDYPLDGVRHERMSRWFGEESLEVHAPEGISYRSRGSFGQWCLRQHFAPEYMFAFAEFGTYPNIPVLAGLRAENRAHHWGRADAPGTRRAKARLRELFVPHSSTWRARVLSTGALVVTQALDGLLQS